MERKSEAANNIDLREQDILKFIDGFQEFKSQNNLLVEDTEQKIRSAYKDAFPWPLPEKEFQMAKETALLFLYGADLAKDMRPDFTGDVSIPRLIVSDDDQVVAFARVSLHNGKDAKCIDTWMQANLRHILRYSPNEYYFSHTQRGQCAGDLYGLPYWFIVDTVITGAEEYAHELFFRKKSPEKLKRSKEKSGQIEEKIEGARNHNNKAKAVLLYHTIDSERRAMVWQQKILERYFPHWGQPLRDFTAGVSKLRLKNLRDSEQSGRDRRDSCA